MKCIFADTNIQQTDTPKRVRFLYIEPDKIKRLGDVMNKIISIVSMVSAIGVFAVHAQPTIEFSTEQWQKKESFNIDQITAVNSKATKQKAFTLDIEALTQLLQNNQSVDVELPIPDGSFAKFRLATSKVMSEELAQKYPTIRTFTGYQIDNENHTGVFDISPQGFHGVFTYNQDKVFIDPISRESKRNYQSYYRKDALPISMEALGKRLEPRKDLSRLAKQGLLAKNSSTQLQQNATDKIRTYRIAIATTGEYGAFHGGTKEKTLAALVTLLNRVNEVYQRDLSIKLELVGANDSIIFTDASSDPFKNTDEDIDLVSSIINKAIGENNYDIGHVVGTGGGGLAGFAVVCSSAKAEGVTGSESPTADAFHIDYVAHEIGHQFGADHTFNGLQGACQGNRETSSAYEPGSASTIMGYAGICEQQNLQNNSDPYFHIRSVDQISTFAKQSSSCGVTSEPSNKAPTVDAGKNYIIPARTPFVLTGSATDPESDSLSYSWEQFDLGAESTSQADDKTDDGKRPLFRTFAPKTIPIRHFPRLDNLLANKTAYGETLPTTNRDLNFRLVVRDNQGNLVDAATKIEVIANENGFALKEQAAWNSAKQLVSWNSAGTENAPVSCASVNVSLSTNSGVSFDHVLVADTPNDGSEEVTVPSLNTSAARVKIACNGNIFFDVTKVDFQINVDGSAPAPFKYMSQKELQVNEDEVLVLHTNDFSFENSTLADSLTILSGENYSFSGTSITPKENFNGELSVKLTATKGQQTTESFVAKITVTAVNDAPIASNDSMSVIQDSSKNLINVLVNDTDIDNESLTIKSFNYQGTANVEIVNNQLSYTPASGYSGNETISYIAQDNAGASATATVNIEVKASSPTPTPTPTPAPPVVTPPSKSSSGGSSSLGYLMMLLTFASYRKSVKKQR